MHYLVSKLFKKINRQIGVGARYYHTIKYLRWQQVFYRFFLKKNIKISSEVFLLKKSFPESAWKTITYKPSHIDFNNKIKLLNFSISLEQENIWQNIKDCDLLWLYHLHYFSDLISENHFSKKEQHQKLIKNWLQHNPLGTSVSWDPYVLSIRIVNWIKWIISGNELTVSMEKSLLEQVSFLNARIEWHLLGNHLLSNAKALIFSGLFFQGKIAEDWYQKGLNILDSELQKQILKDGGHFELSPMYHSLILEDILDVIQLLKLYKKSIPHEWMFIVRRMFEWMKILSSPNGELAFFNDTALQTSSDINGLFKYADYLNLPIFSDFKQENLICLKHSGYCRLKKNHAILLADVGKVGGDYLPAHGHADCLSFELILHDQKIFVNSGTSTYHHVALRAVQRSTLAHNTLSIDKKNSSDVWHRFRVGKRARVSKISFTEHDKALILSAAHDGYQFIQKNIFHHRKWYLSEDYLLIEDKINGKGTYDLALRFFLHPALKIKNNFKEEVIIFNKQGGPVAKITATEQLKILPTFYYPEFNLSIPNECILVSAKKRLPACIITKITFL
mgnify:CR=1 FL=1